MLLEISSIRNAEASNQNAPKGVLVLKGRSFLPIHVIGSIRTGNTTEGDDVGNSVSADAVTAVNTASYFTGSIESGNVTPMTSAFLLILTPPMVW